MKHSVTDIVVSLLLAAVAIQLPLPLNLFAVILMLRRIAKPSEKAALRRMEWILLSAAVLLAAMMLPEPWNNSLLAVFLLSCLLLRPRIQRRRARQSQPKTPLELWLVGTYAIWAQYFYAGLDPDLRCGPLHIGGGTMDATGRKHIRECLKSDWNIRSYQDLLARVDQLTAARTERAWNLCHGTQLLGMAYLMGWCSREEMLRRSCAVGRMLQAGFSSWEDMAHSFFDSYIAFCCRRITSPALAWKLIQQRADIYWELRRREDSPYRLPWMMDLEVE